MPDLFVYVHSGTCSPTRPPAEACCGGMCLFVCMFNVCTFKLMVSFDLIRAEQVREKVLQREQRLLLGT